MDCHLQFQRVSGLRYGAAQWRTGANTIGESGQGILSLAVLGRCEERASEKRDGSLDASW